jgi:hypothetical protein
MSNKIQLQINNASLDECIVRINAAKDIAAKLPEAGGGNSGVCPSLTISGDQGVLGASIYLAKVVYYSDGELLTLTAYDEFENEVGLQHTLTEQPYVIQNIDINKPIVIEAYVDTHAFNTCVLQKSDNIDIVFTEYYMGEVTALIIKDTIAASIIFSEY